MADLGEGPGGPVSPPPLSLGKKKRKAGRASDKKKPPPPHLAQGLDSPLIQDSLGLFQFIL